MGEAAQAWEFLGHAKAAVAVSSHEQADLYAVFGPVSLAVHGVQVATELGDGREALRRAQLVDVGRMPAVPLERSQAAQRGGCVALRSHRSADGCAGSRRVTVSW
jgi:hypothetical protein